ncbi:MutS-related protein [Microlunatus antarcticus]|uniref:DNA mismatch repair proteins mutS family domain-containing protein n=1 Tax=Microlunatus antarcticus TaxID=53388 RepID=A0A7W5JWG0_9ACTN|nr:hypothetical protein [Microlunatus antarcticus]
MTPGPSVLFPGEEEPDQPAQVEDPSCFGDLHLDQVADFLNPAGQVDLRSVFRQRLTTVASVEARLHVFADLERDADLVAGLRRFVDAQKPVQQALEVASGPSYPRERDGWFLEAAQRDLACVADLDRLLRDRPGLRSALGAIARHVVALVDGTAHRRLHTDADAARSALGTVRYQVRIQGARVTVSLDDAGDDDFSAEVTRSFARLRQGPAPQVRAASAPQQLQANHVESKILGLVARLDPAPFAELARFRSEHADFRDPVLLRFATEIQFYLRHLDLMAALSAHGVPFCHPRVEVDPDQEEARGFVDVALALRSGPGALVPNDVARSGAERVLVVTGPNQGGKTTFCRAVGQLFHLTGLGCPVPGTAARLRLATSIDTHFERTEDAADPGGQLEDDLRRIRTVLDRCGPGSVVLVNEMFSSTSLEDAELLGRRVVDQLARTGALTVWVTFVERLARLGPAMVSLVAEVSEDTEVRRTFHVRRRRPDGHSYALALARRHGLLRQDVLACITAGHDPDTRKGSEER